MHPRSGILVALILLATTAAGCISEDTPDEGIDTPDTFQYSDDRFTISGIDDNRDWVPTLEEPPQLSLGEYWKINMQGGLGGKDIEVYVVVAGQEADHWLLGMPTHDFSNDIMVFHLPGLGQITKDTLGFEAHDVWMDPVQFPLEVGNTWTTGFMAQDALTAEVISVDNTTAHIQMVGNFLIDITYDAEMHAISSFQVQGYGGYEVLEHGYDFHETFPELEGTVTVPHMSDLILCHGRLWAVMEITGCALGNPNAPFDTIDIDSTYDRVSFSLILVGDSLIGGQTGVSGPTTFAQVTATSPDGVEYSETLTALDGVPTKLTSFKHDAPGGEWEVQSIVAGTGAAFIEGIGYHVYDVELPSGRILPSIGEHQHGDDEGH